ncbi:dynobactin maturation radical SAM/SPASM protein DynA [Sodalis sp. dw_96]|uniref:dynobactin maturation radical SAM/SPASM protein DynA n=1 Tax=Sodalis sp. dw_96 TaxID=2719794 RepID=UPI001BD60241|nr:dynobactin maturation radical SAM/SPASM protein DynA [Sodalis sp. dw_96]
MNFINVIKPTHICNLACTYCYNEDVRKPIMSKQTLQKLIYENFSYVRKMGAFTGIEFIWHGGEPFIAGIDFYEAAVQFQNEYAQGLHYINTIQTNATLFNNRWLDFIIKNNFAVSVSIDGPKDIHDENRIDHKGRGSFERVMAGIKKLREANISFGSVLVVNKKNKKYIDEIYDFLLSEKIAFNIIPLTKSGSAATSFDNLGLDAEEYADPWIKLYDRWFEAAGENYIYISDFVRKTQAIMAGRAADCIGMSQCGNANCSTDPLGDIYPCASLSGHSDLKFGNINDHSLFDIMNFNSAKAWRTRKVDKNCSVCKWQHVCHGGCQSRSYNFFSGNYNVRDYYCPSLYKTYEHIEQKLLTKGIKARAPFIDHMNDGLGDTAAFLNIQRDEANKIDITAI